METAAARLHPVNFGLALGVLWGLAMCLCTLGAWLLGWGVPFVDLMASLYPGLALSLTGSLLGLIWGFLDGFVGGFILAWLYNKFCQYSG